MLHVFSILVVLALTPTFTVARSALDGVDLSSPAMTEAELSRVDVEAMIAVGTPVDLTRRQLNGVDLSGLNIEGAVLRAARLNKVNLSGAELNGAVLDANLQGANLTGASLFQT